MISFICDVFSTNYIMFLLVVVLLCLFLYGIYKILHAEDETHLKLRRFARTLNSFCLIEVLTCIIFGGLIVFTVITTYHFFETLPIERLSGLEWTAAGIISPLVAGVFGLVGKINETFKEIKQAEINAKNN